MAFYLHRLNAVSSSNSAQLTTYIPPASINYAFNMRIFAKILSKKALKIDLKSTLQSVGGKKKKKVENPGNPV